MEKKKEINSMIIKTGKGVNPYFGLIDKNISVKKSSDRINPGAASCISPPYPFEKLAELYELNSYHARCMQLKAALTCLTGFNLISMEENKNKDESYNQILNWFDNHSIYAGQSFLTTVYNFCLDREIFGNSFIEIVRNNKNETIEFYHIPAKNCRLSKENNILKLIQEIAGEKSIFLPFGSKEKETSEYLMMKSYHPKSLFYGVPDYISAMAAIVLDRSAVKFNIKRFDNNMVLDHIITVVGAAFGSGAKRILKISLQTILAGLITQGNRCFLKLMIKIKMMLALKCTKSLQR